MKRLLAGPNSVEEALGGGAPVTVVYLSDGLKPGTMRHLQDLCARKKTTVEICERKTLDLLAGDLRHQGVLALTGDYPYVDLDGLLSGLPTNPLLVVLDQIQDPGNLGAIARSAHAMGASGLVITKDRSAAMTPAAVRASAGASELIRTARVTNLARCIERLQETGFTVFGAAGEAGSRLPELSLDGAVALVLGNEGKGLRRLTREKCDVLFSIPMSTSFDSLNVSAAAAIALYEASRQRLA